MSLQTLFVSQLYEDRSIANPCLEPRLGDMSPAVAADRENRDEMERRITALACEFERTHDQEILQKLGELAEKLGRPREGVDG